jgi:hypothetical protein
MLNTVKNRIFGGLLPQEFTLGFPEPQKEIAVWLDGAGAPVDVTYRYSVACGAPLTFCIGLGDDVALRELDPLSLKYSRRVERQILGEIQLKAVASLSAGASQFALFEPRRSANYCLPKAQLAAQYSVFAYRHWRKDNTKGVHLNFLESRAMMVEFIRPHPVMLVSVGSRKEGNIFPMNLLGELGGGYFGLALRTERVAGSLVRRHGRIALTTMPLAQGAVAYQLGHNHSKPSFDWDELPFALRMSSAFHIPVPAFALRIREMAIKEARDIGSHTFFLAHIVQDEKCSDGPAFCSIHGFYQDWRMKRCSEEERKAAMAADAYSKRGRYVPMTKDAVGDCK